MSGSFAASLPYRRAPLAFGLCLLAFLFSIEAKTAWYGPFAGFGSSVREAKALPMATPEVVEHGVPAPDPAHPRLTFAILPAAAVISLAAARLPVGGEIVRNRLPLYTSAFFSPNNFFRPPPAC
ncbi:MAG: hypothetical protein ABSB50_00060 [Terracidiphilus sp.]|jgi:hypothetical protein